MTVNEALIHLSSLIKTEEDKLLEEEKSEDKK